MERNTLEKALLGSVLAMSLSTPVKAFNENTLNFVDLEGTPSVTISPIGSAQDKSSRDNISGLYNAIVNRIDFKSGSILISNSGCGAEVSNGNVNKDALISCLKSTFKGESVDIHSDVLFNRDDSNATRGSNLKTISKDSNCYVVCPEEKAISKTKTKIPKPQKCNPSNIKYDHITWDDDKKDVPELFPSSCYSLNSLNGKKLNKHYKRTNMEGRIKMDFHSKLKQAQGKNCSVEANEKLAGFYPCEDIPSYLSSQFKNGHSDNINIRTLSGNGETAKTFSYGSNPSKDQLRITTEGEKPVLVPIYTTKKPELKIVEKNSDGSFTLYNTDIGLSKVEKRGEYATVRDEGGLELNIAKAFLSDNAIENGVFSRYQTTTSHGENGVTKYFNNGLSLKLGEGCAYNDKKQLKCDGLSKEQVSTLGFITGTADEYIRRIEENKELPQGIVGIDSWMAWNLGNGGYVTGIFAFPERNSFSEYKVNSRFINFVNAAKKECIKKSSATDIYICATDLTKSFFNMR